MLELNIKVNKRCSIVSFNGVIKIIRKKFQFPLKFQFPEGIKWVGFWRDEINEYEAKNIMFFWQEPSHSNLLWWPLKEKDSFVSFGNVPFDDSDDDSDKAYAVLEYDNFIMRSADASLLQEYVESYNPVYTQKNSFHEEVRARRPKRLAEHLWVNDKYMIYTRRITKNRIMESVVHIPSICFLRQTNGRVGSNPISKFVYDLFGLSAGNLYFGGLGQIDIAFTNPDVVKKIKAFAKERGAHIDMDISKVGGTYQSVFRLANIFIPQNWFVKESLTFVDGGILFVQKGRRYTDTMYLPLEKCYVVTHTKGFTRQRLCIFGLMNIISKQSFPKRVVNEVIEKARSCGLDGAANGVEMQTSLLWSWWLVRLLSLFLIKPARIIEGEKIYVFNSGRRGCAWSYADNGLGDILKGDIMKKTKVMAKDITSISFHKKHSYSLFGTLVASCSTNSIRKDQKESAGVIVELYHVWAPSGKKWSQGNVVID